MTRQSALKLFGNIFASVFLTSALVLSNKSLLRGLDCVATSAGALSAVHNVVSYGCILLYNRLKKHEAGESEAPARNYMIISSLSATSLISSNILLSTGSVFFHQIARIVCVPVGAFVDFAIEGREISGAEAVLLFGIVGAAFAAATGDTTGVSAHGVVAFVFVASYLSTASYVRKTARLFELSSTQILVRTLPYSVVASVIWVLATVAIMGNITNCSLVSEHIPMLVLNCLLAISVQVLSTWTMKTVSVKLYAVIGQIKTATTVLLAGLIFKEKISVRMRNSFACVVIFGCLLTAVENSPQLRVPCAFNGFLQKAIPRATIALLIVYFLRNRLWTFNPHITLERGSLNTAPNLALPHTINFDRFNEYPWNDLVASTYARILTVREFQVEYNHSSVGKYCNCSFDAAGSGWYQHENICINGDNNVKYLNRSEDVYTKQARDLGLSHASGPLLPAPLSWEVGDLDTRVQILHGNIILLHCWRSPGHNPIHFIFGFGGLFRALLSAPLSDGPFNHVVFHQCPQPHLNHFFRAFWEVLLIEGYDRHAIDDRTTFHVVSDLSRTVCMENVLGNEWGMPPYFGSISHEWDIWTVQLSRYLNYKLPGWRENITLSGEQKSGPIRIAIFQRQEAMNGLRKYLNLPDVLSVVAAYTSDYDVITSTPGTNLTGILQTFNSFDILITPHGSHIANVIFTLRTDVVIIETVGVCVNTGPQDWFSHRLNYLISSGHASDRPEVQEIIRDCREERTLYCTQRIYPSPSCDDGKAEEVMRSDLIIDTAILKNDIEKAKQILGF